MKWPDFQIDVPFFTQPMFRMSVDLGGAMLWMEKYVTPVRGWQVNLLLKTTNLQVSGRTGLFLMRRMLELLRTNTYQ
jgi:hypothetical protein